MNKLHEVGVSAAVGLTIFGLAQLGSSADEEAQAHNDNVVSCAAYMGQTEKQTDILPAECQLFTTQLSEPSSGWYISSGTEPTETHTYYFPAKDLFVERNFLSPEAVATKEREKNASLSLFGGFIVLVAFPAYRSLKSLFDETKEFAVPSKPRRQVRRVQHGDEPQFNEDDPAWKAYAWPERS